MDTLLSIENVIAALSATKIPISSQEAIIDQLRADARDNRRIAKLEKRLDDVEQRLRSHLDSTSF